MHSHDELIDVLELKETHVTDLLSGIKNNTTTLYIRINEVGRTIDNTYIECVEGYKAETVTHYKEKLERLNEIGLYDGNGYPENSDLEALQKEYHELLRQFPPMPIFAPLHFLEHDTPLFKKIDSTQCISYASKVPMQGDYAVCCDIDEKLLSKIMRQLRAPLPLHEFVQQTIGCLIYLQQDDAHYVINFSELPMHLKFKEMGGMITETFNKAITAHLDIAKFNADNSFALSQFVSFFVLKSDLEKKGYIVTHNGVKTIVLTRSEILETREKSKQQSEFFSPPFTGSPFTDQEKKDLQLEIEEAKRNTANAGHTINSLSLLAPPIDSAGGEVQSVHSKGGQRTKEKYQAESEKLKNEIIEPYFEKHPLAYSDTILYTALQIMEKHELGKSTNELGRSIGINKVKECVSAVKKSKSK